jgi:hypothetical protein
MINQFETSDSNVGPGFSRSGGSPPKAPVYPRPPRDLFVRLAAAKILLILSKFKPIGLGVPSGIAATPQKEGAS